MSHTSIIQFSLVDKIVMHSLTFQGMATPSIMMEVGMTGGDMLGVEDGAEAVDSKAVQEEDIYIMALKLMTVKDLMATIRRHLLVVVFVVGDVKGVEVVGQMVPNRTFLPQMHEFLSLKDILESVDVMKIGQSIR
ncbi:hypothetical protein QQ045_001953 [Rhodiola kirilowii]